LEAFLNFDEDKPTGKNPLVYNFIKKAGITPFLKAKLEMEQYTSFSDRTLLT
jgi:hypothetical protein